MSKSFSEMSFDEKVRDIAHQNLAFEYEFITNAVCEKSAFVSELEIAIDQLEREKKFGGSFIRLREHQLKSILIEQRAILKYFCRCAEVCLKSIQDRMAPDDESFSYFSDKYN